MKDTLTFDHERLDVYQVELEFVAWATTLLNEVKNDAHCTYAEVCDQLDRASLSALLNTAKGNGKRQGRQRAKLFDDARGSAVECAACLDALVVKRLAPPNRITDGKVLLLRIVAMLTKLVERFDDDSLPQAPASHSSLKNESRVEGGNPGDDQRRGLTRRNERSEELDEHAIENREEL